MDRNAADGLTDRGQVSAAADTWPLSAREASAALGVSERTVRRAIARGDLPAALHAGVYRITAADLERYRAHGHGSATILPDPPSGRSSGRSGHPALSLPRPLTPLIGRERETATLADLLRHEGVRLVTLTGPGGVGKTRLALQVAAELAASGHGRVRFIPLVAVADPALVPVSVAAALGVRESGDRLLAETLATALGENVALLVLDNFEHLLAAAPFVTGLLETCPGVRLLVTSRIFLRVAGEHAFPVSPLALPDATSNPSFEELSDSAAVRLFVDRARAVSPEFALTPATAPVVAEVCRRVDGLPLAIELAAARVTHLSLPALRERLERRLPLLSRGGGRTDRHRTLRDAIAWSHDLLSADEQALFRRLAVFAGGFPLAAAEQVIEDGSWGTDDDPHLLALTPAAQVKGSSPSPTFVLDGVAALVDASLLRYDTDHAGMGRYRMLETVREFAEERLQASDDDAPAREAHAAYFLALTERLDVLVALRDQAAALAVLDAEHANLRAALTWLRESGPAGAVRFCRFCGVAFSFWWARGHVQEGLDWLDHALALSVPAELRASVLRAASYLRLARCDLDLGAALAREAVEIAAAAGCHWIQSYALLSLGWALELAGDDVEPLRCYEAGLTAARREAEPLPFQVSTLLQTLAATAFRAGDLSRAEATAREGLAVLAPFGERYGVGFLFRVLGWVLYEKGDRAAAFDAWRQAFGAAREMDDPWQLADSLAAFGRAAVDADEMELAARLLGAGDALRERSGRRLLEYPEQFEQSIAVTRAQLDTARFEAAWHDGAGASIGQVWEEIEAAGLLAARPSVDPAAPAVPAGSLTPRERQVLRLLVAGGTDREISEALFISVRTVEHHVAHIIAKLGVHTRTAAASAASAAGLVPVRTDAAG